MVSVSICGICGRNILVPHGTFLIPPLPMRRTHSTFSTLLPQIYTLFSVAPRPASKYAILSASLQPPDNQPFTIQAFPHHLTNAPFPTTKRHLSTHDPCPFEAPSLTFRTSIPKPPQPDTCPTATATLILAAPIPQKRRFRALVRAKSRHNFLAILSNNLLRQPTILPASPNKA